MKLFWPNLSTIRHSPGGTLKKHERPLSGQSVSRQCFEPVIPEYKYRASPSNRPVQLHVFLNISLFWDYLYIVKFWRLDAYIPACYLCKTYGKYALGWISMLLMISYLGGLTDFFLQYQPFNRKTSSEYVGLLVFQQIYIATCINWFCNRLTFAKAKCVRVCKRV
jgi:hypothetical protein